MAAERTRIDWTTVLTASLRSFILGLGVGAFAPAIHECRTGGATALCPSHD